MGVNLPLLMSFLPRVVAHRVEYLGLFLQTWLRCYVESISVILFISCRERVICLSRLGLLTSNGGRLPCKGQMFAQVLIMPLQCSGAVLLRSSARRRRPVHHLILLLWRPLSDVCVWNSFLLLVHVCPCTNPAALPTVEQTRRVFKWILCLI